MKNDDLTDIFTEKNKTTKIQVGAGGAGPDSARQVRYLSRPQNKDFYEFKHNQMYKKTYEV